MATDKAKAVPSDEGQLSGVKRKWLAYRENDAIDPIRTSAS
jgi:hypothetical protein